jgi:hypothetical protein
MNYRTLPYFVSFALAVNVLALDIAQLPENNAAALKQAVEADGGSVEGEPYLVTEAGPDGAPTKLLIFPTPDSLVSLPVTAAANDWTMTGAIRVDEAPYGKSGGPIFGLLFGRNDCVAALTADKWSPAKSPSLMSGSVTLLTAVQIQESGALEGDEWRKISISISGDQWQLKIGDTFSESGTVEGDTRGALQRKGALLMRVGSYGGAATIPVLDGAY